MKLREHEQQWLACFFPSLAYEPDAQRIVGELSFCACYSRDTGKLEIEGLARDNQIRSSSSFLCDAFEIEIRLDSESIEANGWPKVFEVGGRCESIAEQCRVPAVDLHLFEDWHFCLGIKYSPDTRVTIEGFLYQLVIPFLYRLSYTETRGIEAARADLWEEYPHGKAGHVEYQREMREIAQHDAGRNDLCPCGSQKKYKRCCWNEVRAAAKYNAASQLTPQGLKWELSPVVENAPGTPED
jgi:hypothetical protein